jgi:hypothetical protein
MDVPQFSELINKLGWPDPRNNLGA